MGKLRDICLTAIVAVLLLALVSTMINERGNAAAPAKSTAPTRGYYLTTGTFDGSHALAACSAGYHMASVWEIHEPSNLRYDTNLGFNLDDSGLGPPTGPGGWIRTGLVSNVSGVTGVGNCAA